MQHSGLFWLTLSYGIVHVRKASVKATTSDDASRNLVERHWLACSLQTVGCATGAPLSDPIVPYLGGTISYCNSWGPTEIQWCSFAPHADELFATKYSRWLQKWGHQYTPTYCNAQWGPAARGPLLDNIASTTSLVTGSGNWVQDFGI